MEHTCYVETSQPFRAIISMGVNKGDEREIWAQKNHQYGTGDFLLVMLLFSLFYKQLNFFNQCIKHLVLRYFTDNFTVLN